tara:strand:- start:8779 stop:9693 length:915 start_codon:yes stop_codon:yes gene_type:complete
MIELSIIIPTYGRVNKIKNAIESALINDECEVIVVDDNGKGSPHQLNTEAALSDHIAEGKISYYPLETNSGAGVARNYGVNKARGKYITFLDDDDFFIEKNLLEKLAFFKEKSNDYDICCSHMTVEKNGKKVEVDDDKFVGHDAKSFLLNGSSYTSMIMITKKSLIAIDGFFDTPYLQDHTLMLKAYINQLKVCVFNKDVFVHTLHNDATITTGKRPISGVALRCELEKALAKSLALSKSEQSELNYRWNTIKYHADWLTEGRSFSLFTFLMRKVIAGSTTRVQCTESFKLLIKFIVKYQYYSK